MHRLLRRLAMGTGLVGLVPEVRAWRRAFLGVGEAPTVASRMVARHPGLGADRSLSDLGWPAGVQEDEDVHWSWGGEPRPKA